MQICFPSHFPSLKHFLYVSWPPYIQSRVESLFCFVLRIFPTMAAERLRDLSKPMDVALLDATVDFFYATGSKEEVSRK